MANTFSQIYIQTVFAVENHQSLIKPDFREELYKYITGIVRNQGAKTDRNQRYARSCSHLDRIETSDGLG
ncbi:MAG TPA: hypothetical protein VFU37_02425 [Pyrinomonadaceae bacterium]|nr:hypothetical protein [Pyrinomonadaceae bacterium]